jgi:hypothetical protein
MPSRRASFEAPGKGQRSSAYGDDVIHSSILFKQSTKKPKRFQKRFFELNSHYLNYYADETGGVLKGTLDLNECASVSNSDLLIDLTMSSVRPKM